ncbi:MAG TPA: hypothetical protein VJU16_01990 [Planctomycetota bacterium]|nr:hypothetical protein [Planctomycetota bacterium]
MIPILLALAAALQDVEIRATSAYPNFTGSMTFDELHQQGNRVDFEPDTGVVPGLEINVWDWPHRFFLEARHLTLSGRETLDADRRWNESLFAAGETVDIRYDWDRVRLGFEIGCHVEERAYFTVVGALRYDIMRFELESPARGEDDDTIGVVAAEWGVGFRAAFARHWEIDMDFRAIYTDLFSDKSAGAAGGVRIRWRPHPRIAITVGFEGEELSVVKDERDERNRLSYLAMGPSLGIGFSF